MKYTIVGISDRLQDEPFVAAIMQAIHDADAYCGGKRHYELVNRLLKPDTPWRDIKVPIREVFESLSCYRQVVVFASGDPFFYGIGQTIQRLQPEAEITVYPTFNSLQQLAHRLLLPYQEMRAVSLTGRPWTMFDAALVRGEKLIGVLTDHRKTPRAIAQHMMDYGYNNYLMYVGETMGNPMSERVTTYTIEQAAERSEEFATPNCLFLQRKSLRKRLFGIPESDFALLNGRSKMITKMPIRLLTISMLDLCGRKSFWDIGFCTGSVSVEVRMQYPEIEINSFEQRPECLDIIQENCKRHGTPGIQAHIGDFLEMNLQDFSAPDAVFIGGHGGRLIEMVDNIQKVLEPGGVIVFNAVSRESQETFAQAIARTGLTMQSTTHIVIDEFNPIKIMKAVKE